MWLLHQMPGGIVKLFEKKSFDMIPSNIRNRRYYLCKFEKKLALGDPALEPLVSLMIFVALVNFLIY